MTYKEGIIAAITELKDRSGSSSIAVRKVMQAKMPKDKKWLNATYLAALKAMVKSGELVQVKNSYKIAAETKKKMTAKPKTKAASKKKAAAPKKKASSKKKSAKKLAPKKKTAPKKKKTTATKKTAPKKSATKKKAAPKAPQE